MVDFLIVYEHKARELENACLLATELISRGYSVKIKNVLSLTRYFVKAEVVIAPHLYNTFQVVAIAKNFWKSNKKILELQYEQVLNMSITNLGVHNPKGEAIHAQHIAWGNNQVKKYVNGGINKKDIHETGFMSMDLNTPAFNNYFKSREVIAREFNINANKEWVLFISSFSYANKSKKELNALKKINPFAFEMSELMNASRSMILKWLEKAIIHYGDKIFIYRKHPAESYDKYLMNMEKKYKNFVCIHKYSIRQWVRSSDRLYTWFSTSIIDAYFANKSCEILRPIKIPYKFESEVMLNAHFITKYENFISSINSSNSDFPIDKATIEKYYSNKKGKLAYLEIIKICENMFSCDTYQVNYNYGKHRMRILNEESWEKNFKQILTSLIFDIGQYIKLSKLFGRILPKVRIDLLKRFEGECYKTNSEKNEYIDRFTSVLNEIHDYAENYIPGRKRELVDN